MNMFSALGAVLKGFFSSIWDAMRRRRQDKELVENARREVENATLKDAVSVSKKVRKVESEFKDKPPSNDDILGKL